MSPYRLLVTDAETREKEFIFSAMLSVDKKTGSRDIFIVQKLFMNFGDDVEGFSRAAIAHSQTTKKNSAIVGRYRIVKNDDGRRYTVSRIEQVNPRFSVENTISDKEYTQETCLVAAMNDYLAQAGLLEIRRL